jgi:DNA-3-methyladenine glycosylase
LSRRALTHALDDAVVAAEALLGCLLVRATREGRRVAKIVETEAYPPGDPACHAFRGVTRRNRSMFGRRGIAYVYRIHRSFCFNVVTGPPGRGEAVLVRAIEPVEGDDLMAHARARAAVGSGAPSGYEIGNGPGKLCQALDIDLAMDGVDLLEADADAPLRLLPRCDVPRIITTTRVGISVAKRAKLRFVVRDSAWASR